MMLNEDFELDTSSQPFQAVGSNLYVTVTSFKVALVSTAMSAKREHCSKLSAKLWVELGNTDTILVNMMQKIVAVTLNIGVVFLSCPLVKKHADLLGSFLYSQSTMKDMYSKPTNRTELSIPMKTKSIA